MKVAVIGTTAATHNLSQILCKNNEVHHYHAHHSLRPSKKYIPYNTDSTRQDHSQIINFVKGLTDFDLIIPINYKYQIWTEFQKAIKSTGVPYIFPSGMAGMLEHSKSLTKTILTDLGIPTPDYVVTTVAELKSRENNFPIVVKYDKESNFGLQTNVVNSKEELSNLKDGQVVVEEFIVGKEYSYHALFNKVNWAYIGSARDYKKIHDNDLGHNTDGMGSYCPVNIDAVVNSYIDKLFNFCQSRFEYIGFLYLSIIVKDNTPYVLEINTRPGDPEIQSIIQTIDNIDDVLIDTALNKTINVEFNSKKAVTVRIVRNGYSFSKTDNWPLFRNVPKNIVHSLNPIQNLLHSTFTATDSTFESASNQIYSYLENQPIGDFGYRKDIGLTL